MTDSIDPVFDIVRQARTASHTLRASSGTQRNGFLTALAQGIKDCKQALLAANQRDLKRAEAGGMPPAMLDRLALNDKRIDDLIANCNDVRALPDPVGAVTSVRLLDNGLRVERRRTPLGVMCLIYEARPNATIEAAALAIKSGNAIVLRGGSEATESNLALGSVLHEALRTSGLPAECVAMLAGLSRELTIQLLAKSEWIDLVIPRGGPALIESVKANARMPVLAHGPGVCHVYIDAEVNEEQAIAVAVNSKAQRPSTCNSAETLLVHTARADSFLPAFAAAYLKTGGELRGCARTREILSHKSVTVTPATDADWATEYLQNILSVRVVDGIEQALAHIAQYGTKHSDAIMTTSLINAERFSREVDSSCVLVNASTRLNDGSCLGYGAELGISTSKFHAFGPMGLEALTIEKNVAVGDGQTRR